MIAARNPGARWFARPAKAQAEAIRLVCFPHAGGAASFFFDLARRLAPDIECWCVQLPGRGARIAEPPIFSLREMADEIAGALVKERPRGRVAFYGHSFGGVLAYEVALRLGRRGLPQPDHLFTGAAPPPHDLLCGAPVHALPHSELIEAVQARYAGIPTEVLGEPELLRLLLPALRADLAAFETYSHRPEEKLACPITALAGDCDAAAGWERTSGWALYTSGDFENVAVPGGHFFPRTNAAFLSDRLRERLASAREAVAR